MAGGGAGPLIALLALGAGAAILFGKKKDPAEPETPAERIARAPERPSPAEYNQGGYPLGPASTRPVATPTFIPTDFVRSAPQMGPFPQPGPPPAPFVEWDPVTGRWIFTGPGS